MNVSILQRTARLLTVAVVVTMAACGDDQPTAHPQATLPTTEPTPTGRPVGIIAIGHSGLTGEGTGGTFEPVLAKSWATGSDPEVNSVYQRLIGDRAGPGAGDHPDSRQRHPV